MLVYSRPLILLFCGKSGEVKGQQTERSGSRGADGSAAAHLLLLDAPLQRLDVVLHGHVDEPVLGLGLHHPRALRADHLDGLRHVDVAVHP